MEAPAAALLLEADVKGAGVLEADVKEADVKGPGVMEAEALAVLAANFQHSVDWAWRKMILTQGAVHPMRKVWRTAWASLWANL